MNLRALALWVLFILALLLGFITVLQAHDMNAIFLDVSKMPILLKTSLVLAVILLILHAIWTMGFTGGITLLAISFVVSLIFEVIGARYGIVFGGRYAYLAGTRPALLAIPLVIPVYWTGLIYAGYSIASSFQLWSDKIKTATNKRSFGKSIWLVLVGGFIVVAIDLLMDPLLVNSKNWAWLEQGPYFKVPIGNFVGWFVVTCLVIWIFIISGYKRVKHPMFDHESVYVIPSVGYLLLYAALAFWAIKISLTKIVLIGLVTMLPIAISNLVLYVRSITNRQRISNNIH